MTREEKEIALYCLKASSDYHSEVCEECVKYPNCDHTIQDDVTETIIKALEEQELCEDAVSREDIYFKLTNGAYPNETIEQFIDRLLEELETMPPVTPQTKTGRWIAYEVHLPDRTILNYRCSVCRRKLIGYNTETLSEAPFCHCGAKMEGTI